MTNRERLSLTRPVAWSQRSAALRSAIFFTIYPIIDVPSRLSFAVKIIAVTAIANAIGIAVFALGQRRRRVAVS